MSYHIKELINNLQREFQFIQKQKHDIQAHYTNIQSIYDELLRKTFILNSQQCINYSEMSYQNHTMRSFFMLESRMKFVKFREIYVSLEHVMIDLFRFLSSSPILLSDLLIYCDENLTSIDSLQFTFIVYSSVLASNSDGSIMRLLLRLCKRQIGNDPQREIALGKSAFIRLFKFYINNSLSARTFLIAALQDPILYVLQNDDYRFDISSKSNDENDGENSLWKVSLGNSMLDKIAEIVRMFLEKLKQSFNLLPFDFVRIVNCLYQVLMKKQLTIEISAVVVLKSCIDFIFDCFIYPAMLNPEIYGIIGDFPLSIVAKCNLMEIGKVIKSLIYLEIEQMHDISSAGSSILPDDLLKKFDQYHVHNLLLSLSIWSKMNLYSTDDDDDENIDNYDDDNHDNDDDDDDECNDGDDDNDEDMDKDPVSLLEYEEAEEEEKNYNQESSQRSYENRGLKLKKATAIITDTDLRFLLQILNLYTLDKKKDESSHLSNLLKKIEKYDSNSSLSQCVKHTDVDSLHKAIKRNSKFYQQGDNSVDTLNKNENEKEAATALVLPIDQYFNCPGMKSEEKVLKDYQNNVKKPKLKNQPVKTSKSNVPTNQTRTLNSDQIEIENSKPRTNTSSSGSKPTNGSGPSLNQGVLIGCTTTTTTTTNSLSSLGGRSNSNSNCSNEHEQSDACDDEEHNNHSSNDEGDDDSIDSSIHMTSAAGIVMAKKIKKGTKPDSLLEQRSSSHSSSSYKQLLSSTTSNINCVAANTSNTSTKPGTITNNSELIINKFETEDANGLTNSDFPNIYHTDESLTQPPVDTLTRNTITNNLNTISTTLTPVITTRSAHFTLATSSRYSNTTTGGTNPSIEDRHNNSNQISITTATTTTDDGASSSGIPDMPQLSGGWQSVGMGVGGCSTILSGRDTPSISGGRESPSSSVGGLSSDFLPPAHHGNKQSQPDVTEKFNKFDIPKLTEARSTVSDTWSTDVLASDSETTEQQDVTSASRRLVEIIEEKTPSTSNQLHNAATSAATFFTSGGTGGSFVSGNSFESNEDVNLEFNQHASHQRRSSSHKSNKLMNPEDNSSKDNNNNNKNVPSILLENLENRSKHANTSKSSSNDVKGAASAPFSIKTQPINETSQNMQTIQNFQPIGKSIDSSKPAKSNDSPAVSSLDKTLHSAPIFMKNSNSDKKSNSKSNDTNQSGSSGSPSSLSFSRRLKEKLNDTWNYKQNSNATQAANNSNNKSKLLSKNNKSNNSLSELLNDDLHPSNNTNNSTLGRKLSADELLKQCSGSKGKPRNESVDQMLMRYNLQSKTISSNKSTDTSRSAIQSPSSKKSNRDPTAVRQTTSPPGLSVMHNQSTIESEERSVSPDPEPLIPINTSDSVPEQWPAWKIAKRNLRTVLQKRFTIPMLISSINMMVPCHANSSTTGNAISISLTHQNNPSNKRTIKGGNKKKSKTKREQKQTNTDRHNTKDLLVNVLRSYIAEANHLQTDRAIAELEETLRIIEMFDNASLIRMIDSMLKDYRSRKVYISYLVNTNMQLQDIHYKAKELLERCDRNYELISQSMISICVEDLLRQHSTNINAFYKQFHLLSNPPMSPSIESNSPDATVKTTDPISGSAVFLVTGGDSSSSNSVLGPRLGISNRAQLVTEMLDWASRVLNGHSILSIMTEARKLQTRTCLERTMMAQLHRASITLNDDLAEVERDSVFHREIEALQKVINPYQLSVHKKYHSVVPFESAQRELRNINCYKTPMDKLQCIMKTTKRIATLLNMTNSYSTPGADDILPVLIYVIIMANPSRLLSNMSYIDALCSNQLTGEYQYMWCQFNGAVSEVRSLLTTAFQNNDD